MLKLFEKSAHVAAVLVFCTLGQAHAKPKFEEVHLEQVYAGEQDATLPNDAPSQVFVDWEDGKWSEVRDGDLTFATSYRVKMKRGYIVLLGFGRLGRGDRMVWLINLKGWGGDLPKSVAGAHLVQTDTDFLTDAQKDGIVAACNDSANDGNEFTASYDIVLGMEVSAQSKEEALSFGGTEAEKTTSSFMRLKVVCEPPEEDIEPAPKPVSVDLQIKQHGETCPKKTVATAFLNYSEPTTANFRLSVGNGRPKFRSVETREVTFAGKTFHRAEADFEYKLDPGPKTFVLRVRGMPEAHEETVEIGCPPFNVVSAWLTYEVAKTDACPKEVIETATFNTTRPGWVNHEIKHQGGLVVSEGKLTAKRDGDKYVAKAVRTLTLNEIDAQFMADAKGWSANSGWVPLKIGCLEVLGGTLTLTDSGGTQCPRKASALVNMETDLEGPVPYRLDCSNDHSWTRSAAAKKTPAGKYVAVDLIQFDVTKTATIACGLKSLVGGDTELLDFKGTAFSCANTAGVSQTDDIAPDQPRPDDEPPQIATLEGDFSFVDHDAPECTRTGKALLSFKTPKADDVHYSLDCKHGHFSGVAKTQPHPGGGFSSAALVAFDVKDTFEADCTLNTVAPYGQKTHTTKTHVFQCVTTAVDTGADGLAPEPPAEPKVEPKKPDSPGLATEPPSIGCAGGQVKNGACVCPSGHDRTASGKDAWRCVKTAIVPPAPKITCVNGSVKGGACVCPSGHKRTASGKNAWRCVKIVIVPPAPKITCVNGSVKGGACVCPSGHQRTAVGKNAWRCVKTAVVPPPKIPVGCVNGRVKNGTCVCARGQTRTAIGKNAWRCVKATAPSLAPPRLAPPVRSRQ